MKSMKFCLLAFCLAMTTAASAQFANSSTSSNGGASTKTVNTDGYSRIFVSYNPMTMKYDAKDADNSNFTGFSFGWAKGISISKKLPLFVEVGVNGTYAFNKETENDGEEGDYSWSEYEVKTNMFSLNVPVSLAYKFAIPNSSVSIVPFLGVDIKGNIIGKMKDTETIYSDTEDTEEESDDYDCFDKKDMGKDGVWKRVQLGWQIGVGVNFSKAYLGVHYGSDLTELCKKTKMSGFGISLGYNF